jgi:peptidoglycan hydrolase-like protein with peptidoglycan-binding domain
MEMPRHSLARRFAGGAAGVLAAFGAATGAVPASAAPSAPRAAAGFSAAATNVTVQIGQPVAFGDAPSLGSMAGKRLNHPIVGIASTPDGNGYWLVASDGGIFNYGSARYYGSSGNIHLNSPIVGMAAAPDGKGYWLVAKDGGIFNYGSAHYYGSAGNIHLTSPIIGMAVAPGGTGYWIVAADGGIFAYGTAKFKGSTGGMHLNKPIVGMAASGNGEGYWLVASDGGIFAFGSARFHGSAGDIRLNSPIVGMAAAPGGTGYWLVASDGGVFTYGFAKYRGALDGAAVAAAKAEVTSLVPTPDGEGYWLLPLAIPPPPPPVVIPEPTVSSGDSGPAVAKLQRELLALGYWVDTTSGSFDDSTQQAVWALEKADNLGRDGVAGPAVWAALARHVQPRPRSTSGYVIEVDLTDDLVMFVDNGRLEYTLNTSTGGGYTYVENGQTDVATTPTGIYNTYAAIDGTVTDSLGTLWRPRYWYEGYALHGDGYVPPYPVSHGCVRISNEAIDWVWAANLDPIGTEVWVYNT